MKKYAVIVAGGSGSRMKSDTPKQFMLLKGKPVLYQTIKSFLEAFQDLNIILVLPERHIEEGKGIAGQYFPDAQIQCTIGGDSRFDSVKNGLKLTDPESIVFVHDAVRCMVTPKLIRRCHDAAMEKGSAVPAVCSKDSIRIADDTKNHSIDRSIVRLIQTPQVFFAKDLIPAFNQPYSEIFTDEASVAEAFGLMIHLVEGEESNIKITHPVDLAIAEFLMGNDDSTFNR
ncbi:MAG: 2-C-methyl-D-erythritol 4-phosphate cytidylyltransferase [Ferruginibacter sp.]|nr:2-C-methyl-D-erythritol 4-phosphate cytidylyltransferase [Ferruginibacter sp.]